MNEKNNRYNKDCFLIYDNKYIDLNKQQYCECGVNYLPKSMEKHLRSLYHLERVHKMGKFFK